MKICHVAPELLPVPPTKGGAGTAGPGGVWAALTESLDPATWRPRLAAGVEIVDFPSRRGRGHAIISSPDGLSHFRLEPWEARLARTMDGSRSVRDIIVDRLDEVGVEPAPVVGRLDRGDHGDVAEARALGEERDALEQRPLLRHHRFFRAEDVRVLLPAKKVNGSFTLYVRKSSCVTPR